jgi:hypothetical protein
MLLVCGLAVHAAAASSLRESGRAAILSSGDRSLLPSCSPPGAVPRVRNAGRQSCVEMGDSEAPPGSWRILSSGVIVLSADSTMCIWSASCEPGANLTLVRRDHDDRRCATLDGSTIGFASCAGDVALCADPEGREHAVALSQCARGGARSWRALYGGRALPVDARAH